MKFVYLLFPFLLLSCNLNPYAEVDLDAMSSDGPRAIEKPQLKPNYEVNDLRIDVIRQTYEDCDSDGNTTTYDEPYHPLGFDLGNGLFFDLNHNLSVRIDQLFSIGHKEVFIIEVSRSNQPKVKWIYRRMNQKICVEKVKKDKSRNINCRNWDQGKRDVDIAFTKKRGYTIKPNSKELCVNYYRMKKPICIEKTPNNQGYIYPYRKNRVHTFEELGNEFLLGNWYKMEYNPIGQTLIFYQRGKKKDKYLWQMGKNENILSFANDRLFGWRVEKDSNKIVHFPRGFHTEYVVYERVQ